MFDQPLTPYGTDDPASLMKKFSLVCNKTLLTLRNYTTSPDKRKKPRIWPAIEAAKMIGISLPTLRKLTLKYKDHSGIKIDEHGRKYYTLAVINHLRDISNTRYKRPELSNPLVIAVTNLKGGVAKTYTAVDLAKKIAIEGLRCVLFDFDAQGTATLISCGLIPDLELNYEDTITDTLIKDPSNISKIIIKTHFDGFDLIPANLAIQDCDLMLPNEKENNVDELGSPLDRLNLAINYIKNQYDVIIIDCGPNLGMLTLNAISACNGMIIPIPPNMSDYSSFAAYTNTLKTLFPQLPSKKLDYLRIVLTKHTGSNEALQMENMMREQFGRYILTNHMCETVEVPKAANEIGTIYDVMKPRGSRDAYRRAIQHLDDVNMEIINNFKEIWENSDKYQSKVRGD
jgi:chromosome partitioning protein